MSTAYIITPEDGLYISQPECLLQQIRISVIDVLQECRSYFGTEPPSYLFNYEKKQDKFFYGTTARRICFVDIV